MRRFTAYLLLFFVLFTHSSIAMDVHFEHASNHTHEHLSDTHSVEISSDHDPGNCGELGGHCSHSYAHVSGLVSSMKILSLEMQSVFCSSPRFISHSYTQAPPVRSPKVIF